MSCVCVCVFSPCSHSSSQFDDRHLFFSSHFPLFFFCYALLRWNDNPSILLLLHTQTHTFLSSAKRRDARELYFAGVVRSFVIYFSSLIFFSCCCVCANKSTYRIVNRDCHHFSFCSVAGTHEPPSSYGLGCLFRRSFLSPFAIPHFIIPFYNLYVYTTFASFFSHLFLLRVLCSCVFVLFNDIHGVHMN